MICGIDLGSRSVKITLMSEGAYKGFQTANTIDFYRNYGSMENGKLKIDFDRLGLPEVDKVVSTGYGRNTVELAEGENIPEIKAHLIGALHQTGLTDFTLLDLGGQDSKVIKVRKSKMVDFQTNDKCAASTGRYLENMAAVLAISVDELSKHSENPVDLNATCAIFGESELIGKITEGHPISSLSAGINYTIFKRIQPMLRQLASPTLVFTGGVAHNQALKKIIAREMGVEIIVPEHPQYNGAIGCCINGGGGT